MIICNKFALIVNDMGSINIDASLLNKTGNRVKQIEMVEMQNGCICCTLRDEFMAEIERMYSDKSIEAIFVEASGISEPSSIAGAFLNYEEMTENTRVFLKTIVSVVDADRIYREFLHSLSAEEDTEEGDIINLIMDQIEFCNLMILNKTDLLTEVQIQEVKKGLRALQQVGGRNDRDLVEKVLPDMPEPFPELELSIQRKRFEEAGFEILRAEEAYRPIRFYDIGAFVWFARIIEWEFEGFSVDKCFDRLLKMQEVIDEKGMVEGTIHRYLIVARKKA